MSFSKLSGESSLHTVSIQRKEALVEENDVLVKSLCPNDPLIYFHGPAIEDKCWVPVKHVITIAPLFHLLTLQCTMIPS